MKKYFLSLFLLLNFTLISQAGVPTTPAPASTGPTPPKDPLVSNCAYGTARANLDINNIRCLLLNGGDMWWDLASNPRYEVPKVDDPGAIKRFSLFAGSVWVSGNEQGTNNIFVMAMTYRTSGNSSYWPGPIDNLTAYTNAARCQVWDKMFKINRTEVTDFAARYKLGLVTTTDDVPTSVLTWPGKGNPYLSSIRGYEGINTNYDLARFIDKDGNGIYDPLAGDEPRLPGREGESSGSDQCIFWVTNDEGNSKKFSNNTQNNKAIGMEVQTEAFGYATADYVNDMTFYRQKLINKGTTTLEDCYFGQWADPDLGYASDDYVGFNVPRGLAVCYNGEDFDPGVQGYGYNPPTIAIDFFKGPAADPGDGIDNNRNGIIDEPGELIIASNFAYYTNGGAGKTNDPGVAQEYYNYMRSKWTDGSVFTYDCKNAATVLGEPTPGCGTGTAVRDFIPFPGLSDNEIGWSKGGTTANPNPVAVEWSEKTAGNPFGDRRMLTNAGAFTLKPGAVNELTIGVVWARTTSGGATGSFSKLLVADDASQKLFDNDFKILDGPNAPDVEITELDESLLFTIVPHTSYTGSGAQLSTETYQEKDFNSRLQDPYYRFEGYLVYQLKDGSVGFGDLDNADKAVLIGKYSSDVKNGVTKIINKEFDDAIGDFVPRVKVVGTDQGLVHTFELNQDYFTGGKLVNFHKYFYTVLAYGYNGDPAQDIKYLLGRGNRQQYTAIPHMVNSEQYGTILNSSFNKSLDVTRLQGIGNSGTVFDSLNAADEVEILQNGSKLPIKYANGLSPVQVRVYNPKLVVKADLKLRLYSRVSYIGDINQFNIGDRITSSWASFPKTEKLVKDPSFIQKPGIAVVVGKSWRQGGVANQVDLVVEMQNDAVGGRFTSVLNQQVLVTSPNTQFRFVDYVFRPESFTNGQTTATCNEYQDFDYWRLYQDEKLVDESSRPISALKEQLATKFGLLISVENRHSPGEFTFTNQINGYQPGSIVFADKTKPWLSTIAAPATYDTDTNKVNWWSNSDTYLFGPKQLTVPGALEVSGALRNILTGSFAPYSYVKQYETVFQKNWMAKFSGGSVIAKQSDYNALAALTLSQIQNVDLVITPDKSKWTRCVVFQGDSTKTSTSGANSQFNIWKSRVLSVDKTFNPTGELNAAGAPSRGMGWFPGYAIDLDRGIRLNLSFMESKAIDSIRGNNLKWEPSSTRFSNKNYIYVFSTKYDSGRYAQNKIDSLASIGNASTQGKLYRNSIWSKCTWIGRLAQSAKDTQFLATQARVRLRVDKSYHSYPDSGGDGGIPTYAFSTDGLQPILADKPTGESALDLIRVVPNPYYGYSTYEQSQVDNRVRITNLPTRYQMSIYNLSGSLVRQYNVDYSNQTGINRTTYQDWDLKTQNNLPIASGIYLIYINAYELGTKTVKFFGVMRPTDLDAISAN